MSFCNHLKVLLRKNFITLQRNYCFAITFLVLPIITMGFFLYARSTLTKDTQVQQNHYDYMFYSTTNMSQYTKDHSDQLFADSPNITVGEFFQDCYNQSLSQIALVGEQQITDMFQSFFVNNGFNATIYQSQTELFNAVSNQVDEAYCFGIDISSFDIKTNNYSFNLMFPQLNVPKTDQPAYDNSIITPNFNNYKEYETSGFLELYPIISQLILNELSAQNGVNVNETILQVAYTPIMTQQYISINPDIVSLLQLIFPALFMFTYLIPLYYMVSKLSEEKQSKSKEGMKMMGLKETVYFLSWFILFFVVMLAMGLVCICMIGPGLFYQSNKILILIFCIVYGLALFAESVLICSLLPNARSSATLATLFHVITYFMVYIVPSTARFSTKLFTSLLPNIAMALSVYQLFHFEQQSTGLTFATTDSQYQHYSFTEGLLMLSFDFFLYSGAGYYFDQLLCEYGVQKRWYFLCTKKYWCGQKKKKGNNINDETVDEQTLLDVQNANENESDENARKTQEKITENFEKVAETLKRQELTDECLKISNLRKIFGNKVAVNDLCLTMYSGQIFALLGHNGAGKTTTISMLTGLIEKSKGHASVFGINVFEEQDELRKQMGVCPQHDVLFDYLTPKEHLRLFAAFKGTPSHQIEHQLEHMINDLDLVAVQNQVVHTLSGGQKRKLSVGIALIGNSKLIILDEPTSGMDTASRRRLWEMLKQQKSGKIIILTTHYMDEADILGDRIAIMAGGTVKCCGSSLFLKNRFGVGYNLVIAKKNRFDAPQIDNFIFKYIPTAIKLQEVSSEMTFQLPNEANNLFKSFFAKLDENIEQLGISSYGVGITTLEEVFLKIGKHDEDEEEIEQYTPRKKDDYLNKLNEDQSPINGSVADSENNEKSPFDLIKDQNQENDTKNDKQLINQTPNQQTIDSPKSNKSEDLDDRNYANSLIGKSRMSANILDDYTIAEQSEQGFFNLFMLQFTALLKKKLLLQVRDFRSLIIEIFFPIILIACGLALTTLVVVSNSEQRLMSPSIFPYPSNLLYNYNGTVQNYGDTQNLAQNIKNQNPSEWDISKTVVIYNSTQSFPDIESEQSYNFFYWLQQMDLAMFNTQKLVGGYFGNYYFYDMENETTPNIESVVVFANCTSQDAVASYGAFIHEQFLQQMTGDSNLSLKFYTYPFPLSLKEQGIATAIEGIFASILFSMSYMMISKSLVENIIREREKNVKHQILVSGGSLPSYWISHYAGDIIFEALPSLAAIIAYIWFGIDLPGAWAFFIVQIFANPVFVYVLSALFDSEATASILIRIIYIILGLVFPVIVAGLQLIPICTQIAEGIRYIFLIFPIFALNYGIIIIALKGMLAINDPSLTNDKPLSYQLAGPALYFMMIDLLLYWVFLGLIEYKYLNNFIKKFKRSPENIVDRKSSSDSSKQQQTDGDVLQEETRIEQSKPEDLTVRICKLKKTYDNLVAIEKLSFGMEYGECFALLGVTGAGKTTTFKCLTGHEKPTSGDVHINGFDVTTTNGFENARRLIGYCPQFDAIFEGLTVLEHLQFYAKIKGVLKDLREEIVQRQIKEMDLSEYVNIRADKLSGGNKRKLSVAMAMIGNPPIVFLDEPSTGVDPKAKRFMWSIVSKISTQRKKSSVIITTHSMEEAEALCTKMAIMVGGRFKCFGSSQHIKAKFGTGYEIELKIRTLREDEIENIRKKHQMDKPRLNKDEVFKLINLMDASELGAEISKQGEGYIFNEQLQNGITVFTDELIRWIFSETKGAAIIQELEMMFSELQVIEHHSNNYKLKVSRDGHSIGYLFGFMEDIKEQFDVSEYSVSQTTLEQIFNNFAKEIELGTQRKRTSVPRKLSTLNRSKQQITIEEEQKQQQQ